MSSCQGCPNQNKCSSGEFRKPDPGRFSISRYWLAAAAIRQRMSSIKHTLMILSGKGGVGKSTVASQLAFALASQGNQVSICGVN